MKTMAVFVVVELVVIATLLASNLDLNGGAAMISALASLLAMYYAAKAHKASKENVAHIESVKQDVGTVQQDVGTVKLAATVLTQNVWVVQENVQKIEIATNSMKDALIKATHEAALGEGVAKGRAEQHAENKEDAATATGK
jgi:hypothetical protein